MRNALTVAIALAVLMSCKRREPERVPEPTTTTPTTPTPPQAPAARTTTQPTRQPERPPVAAVPDADLTSFRTVDLTTVTWGDAPPALPKGAKVAVLEGTPPFPAGKSFMMLIKFPKGYTIAPHTHLVSERVTLLAGRVRFGHGEKLDKAAMTQIKPGALILIPANHAHYVIAETEAILTVHGVGPWELNYVNPSDDPRGTPPPKPAAFASDWDAPIQPKIIQAADVKYEDPPAGMMPPGIKMAVLEGDPAQAKTYTIRLKLGPGAKVPVHSHSMGERFTIISGKTKFAMGDTWNDAELKELKTPAIGLIPRNQNHYAMATQDTVVQLSGVGPFDMKYAHPEDDPAKQGAQMPKEPGAEGTMAPKEKGTKGY